MLHFCNMLFFYVYSYFMFCNMPFFYVYSMHE